MSILDAFCSDYWAMEPNKFQAIMAFLEKWESGMTIPDYQSLIQRSRDQNDIRRYNNIPAIDVYGVISRRMNMLSMFSGGTSTELIRRDLDILMGDPSVDTILLRVDSPGGSVSGLEELASEIRSGRDRKRIIASVDTLAASAAYWLASQASEIVLTPSGFVGSIGVITTHTDVSEVDKKIGVKRTIITSSKYKAEANPYQPLTNEALKEIQYQIDQIHDRFVAAVADGRGVSNQVVESTFGQGRVLNATDALAAGMIDRVASFEDVVGGLIAAKQIQSDRQSFLRK